MGKEICERVVEALKKRGIRLGRKEMDELVKDIAEELEPEAE